MSRKTVIRRIVQRETQKRGLTEESVLQEAPELHQLACKWFGTWETALQYAGVNLHRLHVKQEYGPEQVLQKIRECFRLGYKPAAMLMRRHHYQLYKNARKFFGTWREALCAAGVNIRHARLRAAKPRRLTTEEIVEALRRWNAAGHSMEWGVVCLQNRALAVMAKGRFNGWRRALVAAGIPVKTTVHGRPPPWNPQRVMERILHRQQEGKPLYEKGVARNARGLWCAAREHFGSWANALAAAGIDPAQHARHRGGRQDARAIAGESTDTESTASHSIDKKST